MFGRVSTTWPLTTSEIVNRESKIEFEDNVEEAFGVVCICPSLDPLLSAWFVRQESPSPRSPVDHISTTEGPANVQVLAQQGLRRTASLASQGCIDRKSKEPLS